MLRVITFLCLYAAFNLANALPSSFYQIDVIVFTHQQNSFSATENTLSLPVNPANKEAIALQVDNNESNALFHTRTHSSSLNREYWALNHNPQYQVLFHYSWLQPNKNQHAITIPSISKNGWSIEGTIRVRQSNYYLLDTNLVFSAQNTSHNAFVFSQTQRLKPSTVYYLDHPHAGMIISVHQLT